MGAAIAGAAGPLSEEWVRMAYPLMAACLGLPGGGSLELEPSGREKKRQLADLSGETENEPRTHNYKAHRT